MCRAVVGLLADLFATLGHAMEPGLATTLAHSLLAALASEAAAPELRADLVAALGEVVLTSRHLALAEDLVSLVLRPGLAPAAATLQLLSAVLQSSMSDAVKQTLKLNSGTILRLIFSPPSDDEQLRASLGLLGDLACNLPQLLTAGEGAAAEEELRQLVAAGRDSGDTGTRELASWAAQQLAAVLPASARAEKRARLAGEVFYSVSVQVGDSYVVTLHYDITEPPPQVSNKQYITQNIETESVTIRLPGPGQVIQCSEVAATVSLPRPRPALDSEGGVGADIRRRRNKRSAVGRLEDSEEEAEKRCKEDS